MTTQNMEQVILEAVQDIYRKKYIGRIEVVELNNGYQLRLGMNKSWCPITISAELNDKDFIEFVKKELRSRHFDLVQYFSGYKYEPEDKCIK